MNPSVLIIPGFGNSGPDHWQTKWEAEDPSMTRIRMSDWNEPVCASWVEAIYKLASDCEAQIVVAHSVGCLAFVHWAARRQRISGALLVAVPDPSGPNFPLDAKGFSPLPMSPLSCRSIVVSSLDDPYGSPKFAKSCADAWGSDFVNIGRAGHINGVSKLGGWPRGLGLLQVLRSQSTSWDA